MLMLAFLLYSRFETVYAICAINALETSHYEASTFGASTFCISTLKVPKCENFHHKDFVIYPQRATMGNRL
jgi:hypothetical protein